MAEKLLIRKANEGFEILANREGLLGLAQVCHQLAALPDDEAAAAKLGNHYHYAEWMNNAEEGSLPLVILYSPSL